MLCLRLLHAAEQVLPLSSRSAHISCQLQEALAEAAQHLYKLATALSDLQQSSEGQPMDIQQRLQLACSAHEAAKRLSAVASGVDSTAAGEHVVLPSCSGTAETLRPYSARHRTTCHNTQTTSAVARQHTTCSRAFHTADGQCALLQGGCLAF